MHALAQARSGDLPRSAGAALVVVGFTGGSIPEVKVNRLLLNNIDVVGVGWGAFWMPRPETVPEQWKAIEPLVASGALKPVLGPVRPLEKAGEAIAEMKAKGVTLLGTGEPRIGAHGTPVVFLHPRDMGGVLIELMQAAEGH